MNLYLDSDEIILFINDIQGKEEARPHLFCKMSLSSHGCLGLLRTVRVIWIRTNHDVNMQSKNIQMAKFRTKIVTWIQINDNLDVMIVFLWLSDA